MLVLSALGTWAALGLSGFSPSRESVILELPSLDEIGVQTMERSSTVPSFRTRLPQVVFPSPARKRLAERETSPRIPAVDLDQERSDVSTAKKSSFRSWEKKDTKVRRPSRKRSRSYGLISTSQPTSRPANDSPRPSQPAPQVERATDAPFEVLVDTSPVTRSAQPEWVDPLPYIHFEGLTNSSISLLPGSIAYEWPPKRSYPFAELPNPFDSVSPDLDHVFLFASVEMDDGSEPVLIGGLYGRDTALVADCSDLVWFLYPEDSSDSPLAISGDCVSFLELETGVFETLLTRGSAQSDVLVIANPANTAVPDRFGPIGHVDVDVSDGYNGYELLVEGEVFDALQASIHGGNGLDEAYILVDGERHDLALDDVDPQFSLSVPLPETEGGLHTIELWGRDHAHSNAFLVDSDLFSERSRTLESIAPGYPFGCGLQSEVWWFTGQEPPLLPQREQVVALARATLNDQGLLVLDGTASQNATQYDWVLTEISRSESYSLSGELVGTEHIPAGVYEVVLYVPVAPPPLDPNDFFAYYRYFTNPDCKQDRFVLFIPPRMAHEAHRPGGTVHVRWFSSEQSVDDPFLVEEGTAQTSLVWSLDMAGYVFDEMGATLKGMEAGDFTAYLQLNEETIPVELDAKGHFRSVVEVGVEPEHEYDVRLYVVPGEGALPILAYQRVIDSLYVFPSAPEMNTLSNLDMRSNTQDHFSGMNSSATASSMMMVHASSFEGPFPYETPFESRSSLSTQAVPTFIPALPDVDQ